MALYIPREGHKKASRMVIRKLNVIVAVTRHSVNEFASARVKLPNKPWLDEVRIGDGDSGEELRAPRELRRSISRRRLPSTHALPLGVMRLVTRTA